MAQINHPDYYVKDNDSDSVIEVIDYIEGWGMNFNLGNVIKYVTRAGRKPGEDALTALQKAEWYLGREIGRLRNEELEA